ncbi:membrane-spanning 4-domains subfamily A member 7 isoform X2 [Microcebus murinus]|uniref:membrane-spanning 4-domains subfamily A member 7 isoform X2 n=1 Tax=Microcebus murinus TaxID=30608 RepID=UPI00098B13AF|nr:membrane-spanning 4-domains subfamily A member 7 isoform X4 [Microcebus murinus]
MLLQPQTTGDFDTFTPKGTVTPKREKPGHTYQKDNDLLDGLPKEVTVLGFAISGCLSIISREKSTKLCTLSSLISNAVSSLTAGAGLFLLADGMVAVGTAFQHCDSEKDYLSSSPYSEYYYPMYEVEDCRLSIATVTGVLVVMLTFTVLELLLAAYTSVFWWKRFYANNPGSEFSLP